MKTTTYSFIGYIFFLSISCSQPQKQDVSEIIFSSPVSFNPPTYICYKVPGEITIDGKFSGEEWDMVPWTSYFVDIEGDTRPKPYHQTRAKMAYDNAGMYFAVWMEEPHIWATITQHDAVIYQDNDFELFLNPSNDTHNYLEYEVNALGTEWDLFLSKPYRDDGCTVLNNWEFAGMKSAVYIDGTLNDPTDTDNYWSVEMFIPWESIYQVIREKKRAFPGDHMRVNFSRVQWNTEVKEGSYIKIPLPGEEKIREHNWVWAPTGEINIHKPEYWGIVQFSNLIAGTGEESFIKNPEDETKNILRNLYYRQQEYKAKTGQYASDITLLSPEEVCEKSIVQQLKLETTFSLYEIILPSPTGKLWHIRQDGLIWHS